MNKDHALTLQDDDPRVVAALDAEQRLYAFYGLQTKTHYVPLTPLGIRVRVTEIGSGKPVVIVPGGVGDVFPLASLMAELKDRRIIAINRPGGGMSEGMDHNKVDLHEFAVHTLTSVLDAFGLDQVPVVAHSIGGHWSLWLALDRPERVTALALLGVPGNLLNTAPPPFMRLLSVPVLNRLMIKLIVPRNLEQARAGMTFMGHSKETCARFPEAAVDCFYHFPRLPHYQTSFLSLMNQAMGVRLDEGQLKGVRQPVIFLWGNNDPFGSVEIGRKIAEIIPSSAFHVIQGGGHLPWLDSPAECGSLIRDFLKEEGVQ
jgi:2-hydroxy-6-oxonona-2,4-dienedioate hydrolase